MHSTDYIFNSSNTKLQYLRSSRFPCTALPSASKSLVQRTVKEYGKRRYTELLSETAAQRLSEKQGGPDKERSATGGRWSDEYRYIYSNCRHESLLSTLTSVHVSGFVLLISRFIFLRNSLQIFYSTQKRFKIWHSPKFLHSLCK